MFSNIGKKIKTLAKIICWLGIIASVIYAIAIWSAGSQVREAVTWSSSSYYNGMPIYETGRSAAPSTFLPGLIVLVIGCLLSWVGSFCLYGFGELIDRTKNIDATLEDLHSALSNRAGDTAPRPTPVKEPAHPAATEPKAETPPEEETLPEEEPESTEPQPTEQKETEPAEKPLPEPEAEEAEEAEEAPAEEEAEQPVPEEPEPEIKEEQEPEPTTDTESEKQKAIEELIRKIASGEISLDAYGWALNDENRRYVHCPGCGKKYSSVYMRGQEACPGCGYPHVKQSGNG